MSNQLTQLVKIINCLKKELDNKQINKKMIDEYLSFFFVNTTFDMELLGRISVSSRFDIDLLRLYKLDGWNIYTVKNILTSKHDC